jgi:hypothetical protein
LELFNNASEGPWILLEPYPAKYFLPRNAMILNWGQQLENEKAIRSRDLFIVL